MCKNIFVTIILILSIVVTGCSSNEEAELESHDNIRNDIVEDSYEVMKAIDKSTMTGEKENVDLLLDYNYKYRAKDELSMEEQELVLITSMLINDIDSFINGDKDFRVYKRTWYKTLEEGKLGIIE